MIPTFVKSFSIRNLVKSVDSKYINMNSPNTKYVWSEIFILKKISGIEIVNITPKVKRNSNKKSGTSFYSE